MTQTTTFVALLQLVVFPNYLSACMYYFKEFNSSTSQVWARVKFEPIFFFYFTFPFLWYRLAKPLLLWKVMSVRSYICMKQFSTSDVITRLRYCFACFSSTISFKLLVLHAEPHYPEFLREVLSIKPEYKGKIHWMWSIWWNK